VASKLKKFTERVNENNSALSSFVGEISVQMDDWYQDYSQFEDQTVAIAPGYFSPLRDVADDVGATVNLAYDQMAILEGEGNEVLADVTSCLAQLPAAPVPGPAPVSAP
jgi:hypothetical protein